MITARCAQRAANFALRSTRCKLRAALNALHTSRWAQRAAHFALRSTCCKLRAALNVLRGIEVRTPRTFGGEVIFGHLGGPLTI